MFRTFLVCSIVAANGPATSFCVEPATIEPPPQNVPPQSTGISLLARDSLSGWREIGEPGHWTLNGGQLSGGRSSRLLLPWVLHDFDLELKWRFMDQADRTGSCSFVFTPTKGRAICWVIGDGESANQPHEQRLGVSLRGNENEHVTLRLRRTGKSAGLFQGDRRIAMIETDSDGRGTLSIRDFGGGVIEEMHLIEPAGESVFNGQDLTGWWTPGNIDSWQADHGELVCLNRKGNYLRSEKEYGDFTLSLEYLAAKGCNSGIGIRTPRDAWPSGDGIELQIYDHPGLDKHSTMSLYGNLEPLARADESEKWNSVVVKSQGSLVGAWVNGQLVQFADLRELPELRHRHPAGWIGFQDHGGPIRFRNIRVRSLGAQKQDNGEDFPEPAPEPKPTAIADTLDRLMNSQSLIARRDWTSTAVAVNESPAAEDGLLANLEGPGALVRLWRDASDGNVALYFDDEEKPRIECPYAALYDHVPMLSEEREPLLTCVPFERGLKIRLSGAQTGPFRVDAVRFAVPSITKSPSDVLNIHSFGGPLASIPRGWLSAINYRLHQFENGRHREFDPYQTKAGPIVAIPPGEKTKLLELTGGGVVNWWKLAADPAVLRSDDLWLEVYIGDEVAPSIAAPARYLFAPLAAGTGHQNFVTTGSGGTTSFLAMPFDRLKIVGQNRGAAPIGPVGCTVNWQVADDSQRDQCLRLTAHFLAAGNGPLVNQQGKGRWIGLVCQTSHEAEMGIKRLVVDGEARPGWAANDFDSFLGRPAGKREFYRPTSGQAGELAWRWLLMEAVDFHQSLALESNEGDPTAARLAWFYLDRSAVEKP